MSKVLCPVCAASLNAENLDKHLAKVHAGARPEHASSWRGEDCRVGKLALAAFIATVVPAFAVILATESELPSTRANVVLASTAPLLLLSLAGFAGWFRATVGFEGDAIVLRHTFGLLKRRTTLPCSFETGELIGTLSSPGASSYEDDYNMPGSKVSVGSYLRVGQITLGHRRDAKHWTARDPRKHHRSTCDILLAREALAAFEYALETRGVLLPPADSGAGTR